MIRVPADVMLKSDREHMNWLRELATMVNTLRAGSFTWDPPNVPGGTVVTTTITSATESVLAGLTTGMPIKVTPPSAITAGLLVEAWVSADDSLTIALTNITGGAIDDAAATWAFMGVTL